MNNSNPKLLPLLIGFAILIPFGLLVGMLALIDWYEHF